MTLNNIEEIASFIVEDGKGILAADESNPTCGKRFDSIGVESTFTVQLRNNTYNALSEKNIEAVSQIRDLGHHIGLHQNPPPMDDELLIDYILKDIETLEHYYGFQVDRFAFHRCGSNPGILEKYVEVPNKINCYSKFSL